MHITSLKRTLGVRACSVVHLIALATVLIGPPRCRLCRRYRRACEASGRRLVQYRNSHLRHRRSRARTNLQRCARAQLPLWANCPRCDRRVAKGQTVRCEKQAQDTKFGRPVAICYADGVDVGAEMVDRGLAVAYRRFSLKYVPNEDQAKAAKRGIWAGAFETPGDYRARTLGGENSVLLIPSTSG